MNILTNIYNKIKGMIVKRGNQSDGPSSNPIPGATKVNESQLPPVNGETQTNQVGAVDGSPSSAKGRYFNPTTKQIVDIVELDLGGSTDQYGNRQGASFKDKTGRRWSGKEFRNFIKVENNFTYTEPTPTQDMRNLNPDEWDVDSLEDLENTLNEAMSDFIQQPQTQTPTLDLPMDIPVDKQAAELLKKDQESAQTPTQTTQQSQQTSTKPIVGSEKNGSKRKVEKEKVSDDEQTLVTAQPTHGTAVWADYDNPPSIIAEDRQTNKKEAELLDYIHGLKKFSNLLNGSTVKKKTKKSDVEESENPCNAMLEAVINDFALKLIDTKDGVVTIIDIRDKKYDHIKHAAEELHPEFTEKTIITYLKKHITKLF